MNTLQPVLDPFAVSEPGQEVALSVDQAFHRYHDGLVRFLRRRLHDEEEAADIAQETYARLAQSYQGQLDARTASSLIYRIAINVANDLSRRRKTHYAAEHCSADLVVLVSEEPSQERQVYARQQLDVLYAAIEGLPPRCQQVFLLNRIDRMTYARIAQHCGISTKMVEKHMTKALAILRDKVGGDL